jgi:HD-GYP domain-containing protein (c-di-GMP phosphodiesterase class II)
MQQRFAHTASQEDATQQAWIELAEVARQVAAALADAPDAIESSDSARLKQIDQVLAAASPASGGAMLVDGRKHVLVGPGASDRKGGPAPHPTRGSQVSWTSLQERQSENPEDRGYLQAQDGRHLAVSRMLPGGDVSLIVHRSTASVQAAAAATLASIGGIAALTWVWTTVLIGIATYMVIARFHDEVESERARTVADQLHQRQKLLRTRDAVIFGLAKLADSRDPETGDHLERISVYSTTLASVLRHHPKYAAHVTPSFVRLIGISSALHDIGKVGVEDRVLLKPGPLTAAERARIQEHAEIGGHCLQEIERRLGSTNFLQMAREIAFAHHERWDGAGYPQGIKGEDIPLAARIVAIADVYDALSSRRVYKGPRTHEDCVEIIRKAAGTQFDPTLVEVWLTIESKFRDIARRYADVLPGEQAAATPPPAAPEVEFGAEGELVVAGKP